MVDFINNWKSKVIIDGVEYESGSAVPSELDISSCSTIILLQNKKSSTLEPLDKDEQQYQITVRQYMTKKSTPSFDFMAKWNHDNPMPLRTMVGTKVKETRGMVYMKLHAEIVGEQMQFCMKCGRPITNPVSQYFGMGPECGQHGYVNPFDTKEELEEAVKAYQRDVLSKITWEGWIIKSAILEEKQL